MARKNCFERYKNLKLEQQRLNDLMETLLSERERLMESGLTVDSVQGSDVNFPYTAHSITIEGYTEEGDKIKHYILNMEINRVRKMQINTEREMAKIRKRVDGLEDEFMRSIVTYRFIYGMSWRQVAFRVGGGISESGVRMAYNRFIEKK